MAKHDENKDLRLVGRVCKLDFSTHSITCSKDTILGIHMLGKIDYLTHYCGWRFYRTANFQPARREDGDNKPKKKFTREDKKASKTPKLTNKKK